MPRGINDHQDAQDARIVSLLRESVPGVVAIYRFGSSATRNERPDSDIDVAVLAGGPLDPHARYDVQERLASALHRPVDLVDLRRATTVMASQIVTTGVLLHESDAAERQRFESRVYSAYARLNEERRGILERIAAEGTVYGR
jgi:predicted nucleotidyltransferase